jgi:hypothetical protein
MSMSIKEQLERDHAMAMALSLGSSSTTTATTAATATTTSQIPVFMSTPPPPSVEQGRRESDIERQRREQEEADHAFALSLSSGAQGVPPPPPVESRLEIEHSENPYYVGNSTSSGGAASPVDRHQGGGGWLDDLSLAKALQAMEFEIASEMQYGGPEQSPEEVSEGVAVWHYASDLHPLFHQPCHPVILIVTYMYVHVC